MIRVYAYIAALAVVIGAMLYIDHRGYERGKMACQAERTEAVNRTQKAIDLRDQRSADVRVDMLDMLRVTIPPLEIKAHEAAERIRVVYRSLPADACMPIRPRIVQDELDKARDAANESIGSLRRATPDNHPTRTSMAGDRPMGHRDDEPVPTGSGQATGDERMSGQSAQSRGD